MNWSQDRGGGGGGGAAERIFTFVLSTEPGLVRFCLKLLFPTPEMNKNTVFRLKINLKKRNAKLKLQMFLTLGRTPVTPANRHKKNLEENNQSFILQLMKQTCSVWLPDVVLCVKIIKLLIRFWLFGLAAVGVIHHHAASETCPHGLTCNQLQLGKKLNEAKLDMRKRLSLSQKQEQKLFSTCSEFSG